MKVFMIKSAVLLAGLFLIAVVSGCGEDDPLELAWDQFIAKRYNAAFTEFESLVDTHGSEAYIGMGWCRMKQSGLLPNVDNSDDFIDDADEFFELASGDSLIHGFAGWVIVAWHLDDWDELLARANFVMQENSRFVFIRDKKVDFGDIIWHQASAYFHLGQLTQSLERIQELDATFAPNLSDPNIVQIFTDKLASLSNLVGL